jgi:hypothetical protein
MSCRRGTRLRRESGIVNQDLAGVKRLESQLAQVLPIPDSRFPPDYASPPAHVSTL